MAAVLLACGATEPEARQVEWVQLTLESGGTLDIAVLRPGVRPEGGWWWPSPGGAGDAGLLLGLMQSYWDPKRPRMRGTRWSESWPTGRVWSGMRAR